MCHAFAAHRRRAHHESRHESGEGFGPWGQEGFMPPFPGAEGFGPWGSFGVRRPLRFLAHKLDLEEKQVLQLARVLDELKTERAQVAVDERRTLAEFADALGADGFDESKAAAARDRRGESNRRLNETLVKSLREIHALLSPDQRERLSHLIRAGILTV